MSIAEHKPLLDDANTEGLVLALYNAKGEVFARLPVHDRHIRKEDGKLVIHYPFADAGIEASEVHRFAVCVGAMDTIIKGAIPACAFAPGVKLVIELLPTEQQLPLSQLIASGTVSARRGAVEPDIAGTPTYDWLDACQREIREQVQRAVESWAQATGSTEQEVLERTIPEVEYRFEGTMLHIVVRPVPRREGKPDG